MNFEGRAGSSRRGEVHELPGTGVPGKTYPCQIITMVLFGIQFYLPNYTPIRVPGMLQF